VLSQNEMGGIFVRSTSKCTDSPIQMLSLLPELDQNACDAICQKIDRAKKEIQIAMFTFTHDQVVQSLIKAIQKGIRVTVAIDRYTREGASKKCVETLLQSGARILVSQGDALHHHKWALIDHEIFILGSANWTKAAFTKNQDCLFILEHLSKDQKDMLRRLWRGIEISMKKG
jgi:cardiolipin synthase A/B